MKISVIVPVYNTAAYLKGCMESILAQTFEDFEVLLVDDGSTDESPALCDAYAEQDRRVKVIHRANGGVSAARNQAVEQATGEWICYVDSDDEVKPDYLKTMVEAPGDLVIGNLSDDRIVAWYGKRVLDRFEEM